MPLTPIGPGFDGFRDGSIFIQMVNLMVKLTLIKDQATFQSSGQLHTIIIMECLF